MVQCGRQGGISVGVIEGENVVVADSSGVVYRTERDTTGDVDGVPSEQHEADAVGDGGEDIRVGVELVDGEVVTFSVERVDACRFVANVGRFDAFANNGSVVARVRSPATLDFHAGLSKQVLDKTTYVRIIRVVVVALTDCMSVVCCSVLQFGRVVGAKIDSPEVL